MATDKKAPAPKAGPKTEAKAEAKTEAKTETKTEVAAKSKDAPAETAAKTESADTPAPADYSRGEGQKPVTKAYKENWDAIFGKKKKKR